VVDTISDEHVAPLSRVKVLVSTPMTTQCQKPEGYSVNAHYGENLKMQAFTLKNMSASLKTETADV
jgi:hypothetical protein